MKDLKGLDYKTLKEVFQYYILNFLKFENEAKIQIKKVGLFLKFFYQFKRF